VGKTVTTQAGWNRDRWNQEWFNTALADLKAWQFTRFTHNLVQFNATPKRIAWDDDEGWRALEEKLRICAWPGVCRASGLPCPRRHSTRTDHPLANAGQPMDA
jgi:hypothetical protein